MPPPNNEEGAPNANGNSNGTTSSLGLEGTNAPAFGTMPQYDFNLIAATAAAAASAHQQQQQLHHQQQQQHHHQQPPPQQHQQQQQQQQQQSAFQMAMSGQPHPGAVAPPAHLLHGHPRPALALDTTGSSFQVHQTQPQSGASSSGALDFGVAPEVLTPGMPYFSPYPINEYAPIPPPIAPPYNYYPGTISPSQLPHQQLLKPTKSFSDLIFESRQSSVSASSTEHEWTGVEDLSMPLRALMVEQKPNIHAHPSMQQHHGGHQHSQSFDLNALTSPARGSIVNQAVSMYMNAPNRLALGERKILIMSPKVGQKSYGVEKRFLCPHPQATLIGQSWFTQSKDDCPVSPLLPPRVNISLSGEATVKDVHVSWTTLDNKSLDDKINAHPITKEDKPFLGNVAGKNLHISDTDSKRREVKALVTVKAPFTHHAGRHGWGPAKGTMADISNDTILGTFESKEIKVISKPSKKKSSSKSADRELPLEVFCADLSDYPPRHHRCSVQPRQVTDVVHPLPVGPG